MKNIIHIISSLVLIPCMVQAQKSNPFKSINKEAQVHTLSNGKYTETYDDDVLQRIGTVIIDRRTNKIVKLLDADSIANETSDNSTVSRWYSIDPLAEKYYSISPYVFCANNPIIYTDPNGAELQLTGQASNVSVALGRIQNSVGGSYSVSQNSNGSVIMTPNSSFSGTVSVQEQAAINTYSPITSLQTGLTAISVVNNSDQVDVGSFATGQIDVGDIAKYDNYSNTSGEASVYSGNGKMIHEVSEQFEKQANGSNAFDAHNTGIANENSYNGSTRPVAIMRNGNMIAPSSDDQPTGTMKNPQTVHRQNVKTSSGNTVTVVETYNVTNAKAVTNNPNTQIRENLIKVEQTPQQH